jgi:hypothetical protein
MKNGFECFVCVFAAFSLHRESPDSDTGRWTSHFLGGSVTQSQSASTMVVSSAMSSTSMVDLIKCHTPFRDSRNEASICVPSMFRSHV